MRAYILYFHLYLSICLGYHPRFLLQVHSFTLAGAAAAAAAPPSSSLSSSQCKQRGQAITNSAHTTTPRNNKYYSRKGIQSVLWKCQQFTNKSKCHATTSSSSSSSSSDNTSSTTSSSLLDALDASTTITSSSTSSSSTTPMTTRPTTMTTTTQTRSTTTPSSSSSCSYQWSLTRMALTIASTYFTWHVHAQQQTNGISNVMASSSIALLCTMLTNNKSISNAVFCGTFAGMSSHTIIPSWNHALLLGIITCAFYERMIEYKNQFVGLGGRLGLMAFVSTWMVVASMTTFSSWDNIMTSMVLLLPSRLWSFFSSSSSSSNMVFQAIHPLSTLLPMVFWHVVGSILTIWLRRSSSSDETRAVDPVRAASVVGMAGALLLPTIYKSNSSSSVALLALYGGSFVGMSAPSRLLWQGSSSSSSSSNDGRTTTSSSTTPRRRSDGVWLAFGMAAALAGVVHGITIDWGLWMGGWGGKAGACAFVGCVLYRCLVTCWMRGVVPVVVRMWNVRNKNKEEEEEVQRTEEQEKW